MATYRSLNEIDHKVLQGGSSNFVARRRLERSTTTPVFVDAFGRAQSGSSTSARRVVWFVASAWMALAAAPRAQAVGFAPKTDFGTGTAPRAVAIGDLNGDGKPDLATANTNTSNVSVLLGTGGGSFGAKTDFTGATNPYGIAIGDINRDGWPDLAVANNSASSASVFLGNGAGGFPTRNDFATGTNARTIVVADLDVNDTLDLVTANSGANNVSVLLGNGTGTAGGFARTDYATALFPFAVAVGDVNLDGLPDLAVTNENSASVSVLLGTGSGVFGAHADFSTGGTPHSVAIADMNRDGRPDLVVANQAVSTISVLLGNGTGGFGTRTDFTSGSSPYALAVADVDGDGRLDVVAANQGAATVSVLLGDGAGGLGAKTDFTTGTSPQWVAIGDVNGDGRPDLAVANTSSNTVSILLNTYPAPAPPLTFGRASFPVADASLALSIADLDRNGMPDLAVTSSADKVSVLLGTGTGSFGPRTDFATGDGPGALAAGDVSGDGKPDLVAGNGLTTTVSVLLGTGSGGFGAKTDFLTSSRPQGVAVGDFNRDGKPDVAAACFSNRVSILLGTGGGGFGAEAHFATASVPNGIVVGDFDRDGNLDLVTSQSGVATISTLRGTGTGTFAAFSTWAAGGTQRGIAAGDFNADGKLDVAVSIYGSSSVSVLLGDGTGGFLAPASFTTGPDPNGLAIGDLNGDGKLDLVTANYSTLGSPSTVSVLLGTGAGGFGAKTDFPAEEGPHEVAIGDVNRDGRPDIAVSTFVSHGVAVLLNGYVTVVGSVAGGGTISPSGAVPVAYGATQTFMVTGSVCHPILDVVVDGVSVGAVTSYTFTNLTGDHTIAASFGTVNETITATAGPGGTISPSGDVLATCGTNQSFTITPDPCRRVADVVVDGQSAGANPNLTLTNVQANHTVSASFASAAGCAIAPPTPGSIACASPSQRLCALEPFDAAMTGANEVPPTGSTATGFATFTLDGSNNLHYDLRFFGLSGAETVAHIHGPALPGANAPVLYSLPPGNPSSGQITLTPTQVGYLHGGQLYVNVHSAGFPGGEMRGQLAPRLATYTWSVSSLDPTWAVTGGQGTPCIAFTSGASGGALFKLVAMTAAGCRDSTQLAVGCGTQTGVAAPATFVTGFRALPNPMFGAARIDYTLAAAGWMRLDVFSLAGRRVRTLMAGARSAGPGTVDWDGRSDHGARLAAGVYMLRLTGAGSVVHQKVLLLR
jgi:CHRD domain-containing protein/VCBS repeat protein/flagellar hook capping protein FlgD/FG-GAP repeat protein